jgi:hypothetical protein
LFSFREAQFNTGSRTGNRDTFFCLAKRKRSNRLFAENRAEETQGRRVVAKWNAALRKTEGSMVHLARKKAWSWVTSSTLVNRFGDW